MFSLQTIFGQGNQFYTLLEEAAVAAHDSTTALHVML
ncbi:MAG TPA: pit accessory protein, partial [Lysobacter sp.]